MSKNKRRLWTTSIPYSSFKVDQRSTETQISNTETLNDSTGSVIENGVKPSKIPIMGQVRGSTAKQVANEIDEYSQNSEFGAVPWFEPGNDRTRDQYVAVERSTTNPINPRAPLLQKFDMVLRVVGTTATHRRGIATSPVTIDNPFSSGVNSKVGIPAKATNRTAYDETNKIYKFLPIQSTFSTEFDDIDRVDATSGPGVSPIHIFKNDFSNEGRASCRVWDTFGQGTKTDNGVNVWQKVISPRHSFDGDAILENGAIRVTMNTASDRFLIEEWNGFWDTVIDSNNSSWILQGFNINSINPAEISTQVTFLDPSTGDQGILNMFITRGTAYNVLYTVPDNFSQPPSGLESFLSPSAVGWGQYPQPQQGVISKSELER